MVTKRCRFVIRLALLLLLARHNWCCIAQTRAAVSQHSVVSDALNEGQGKSRGNYMRFYIVHFKHSTIFRSISFLFFTQMYSTQCQTHENVKPRLLLAVFWTHLFYTVVASAAAAATAHQWQSALQLLVIVCLCLCLCLERWMQLYVRQAGKKCKNEIDRKQINYFSDKNGAFLKHIYQRKRPTSICSTRACQCAQESESSNDNNECVRTRMHKTPSTTTITTFLCHNEAH